MSAFSASDALDARARRAVRLAALARGVERIVLGSAVLAVGASPTTGRGVVVAALAIGFMAVRSIATIHSDLVVRRSLYLAVAESLTRADAMQPVPLPGGDAEGALSDAVYSGTRVLGTVIPTLYGDVVASVILAGITIVLVDWPVAVLGACGFVLLALGSVLVSRTVVRMEVKHVEALLAVHAGLGELLDSREEIAATGGGAEVCGELAARLGTWQRRAVASRLTASIGARVPMSIGIALLALGVIVSPRLREVLESVEGAALLALVVLVASVLEMVRGALELRRATPELAVLGRLLDLPPLERGGTRIVEGRPSSFTATKLSFAYGAGRVLDDVSFEWHEGTVLVFAGSNGAGKSTMLRLLLGFARPSAGALAVDSTDLFDFNLTALRRQVAYVPQRPALAKRRTVREVLSCVDGGDAGSIAALVRLGFGEDTPPSFLDRTMATLSAGQAQRIALARAFASKRPLLLLDEPDANLDERSVECLAARLCELKSSRMIAVAAHHPKILACADCLVTLESAP